MEFFGDGKMEKLNLIWRRSRKVQFAMGALAKLEFQYWLKCFFTSFSLLLVVTLPHLCFANSDGCDRCSSAIVTKAQQVALCHARMALECGDLIRKLDDFDRSRKLKNCGEEWTFGAVGVGLQLRTAGECIAGGAEGVWDTVTFIPKTMWSAWKTVKQSAADQASFKKFCDNDPIYGCKRDLMRGIPSLESLDPAKVSTNEILEKRAYWIRTIKNASLTPKFISERAEEAETYAKKREATGDTLDSRQDFQELMARAKMALVDAGIKFECYKSTYQTNLICYGASSVLAGVKGADILLKARKLAGATYSELSKIGKKALSPSEFSPGNTYATQFKGDPDIYELGFLRREGDEYIFKVGSKEYRRRADDVHEVRTLTAETKAMKLEDSSKSESFSANTKSKIINNLEGIFVHSVVTSGMAVSGIFMASLLTGPTKKIVELGSVQVIGKLSASRKVGIELVNEVTAYDSQLKGIGFRLPDKTNIVLNDRPLLPNFSGPVSHTFPLTILGRGAAESTIVMNPILYRSTVTRDLSVLRHERTHSVLFATYARDAYINSSLITREALADFFSAHAKNNPEIGKAAMNRNSALRNIETREANGDIKGPGGKGATQRTSLMDVLGGRNSHNDSLIISNALWRVRQALGSDTMTAVIKPIADDLNLHRGSATIIGAEGTAEYAKSEIQYNLASIKRTLSDRGLTDGVRQIDRLADELGITARRLSEDSNRLTRQGDFAYRGSEALNIHVIALHAGAAATTGAAAGYGINQFIPEANFFVREPNAKESQPSK